MFPSDGRFLPYEHTPGADRKSPTNGRIYVLSFQSSTQKYFFWMQSKNQHPAGDPSWFSPRDLKYGEIVDRLLQGDQVNVQEEVSNIQDDHTGQGDGADHMDIDNSEPQGQADGVGNNGAKGEGASKESGANSGQS